SANASLSTAFLCSNRSEAQRLQGSARKSSEVLSVSSKLRSGRPQWAISSLISIFRSSRRRIRFSYTVMTESGSACAMRSRNRDELPFGRALEFQAIYDSLTHAGNIELYGECLGHADLESMRASRGSVPGGRSQRAR